MEYQRFSTIHEHCRTCFSRECTREVDYATSCEVLQCDVGCGRIFHACKQVAHMQACPFRIVPCVNQVNGCYLEVRKSDMAKHLMVCPANVVVCQNYTATSIVNGCLKNFRREEYSWHNLNVHAEISPGTTLACPLAIAGCKFTCQKSIPSVPECKVVHSTLFDSYGIVTDLKTDQSPLENDNNDDEDENSNGNRSQIWESTNAPFTNRISGGFGLDYLPVNVLEDIILLLDSFSINNLSLTNTFLRNMCRSVLHKKGMVVPVWSKTQNDQKQMWDCSKWKWSFSTCFTPIRQWKYNLSTPLSEHLKACPFYPERRRNDNDIIECENKCGLSFPRRQLQEHKKRCQMEIVACINKTSGCEALVIRSKMAVHLRSCPANVVQCKAYNTREEMNGICRRIFRKGEIADHLQFTHLDLCDDLVLSCPFKNDGCTFAIDKKTPRSPKVNVTFDSNSKVFNVISPDKENEFNNPNSTMESDENSSMANDTSAYVYTNQMIAMPVRQEDTQTTCFENMPLVLKQHIISFLDSLSIRSLARTSTDLREVCKSVLEEKGVVDLVWEKSNGKWEVTKKKRYFSTACSPVHQWEHQTRTAISEHLKECPYFKDKNIRSEKVLVMLTLDNLPEMLKTWKS